MTKTMMEQQQEVERTMERSCRRDPDSTEELSAMERECLIERRRTAKLVECKEMLRRNGAQRYARDAFKTLFHNEVCLSENLHYCIPIHTGRNVCGVCRVGGQSTVNSCISYGYFYQNIYKIEPSDEIDMCRCIYRSISSNDEISINASLMAGNGCTDIFRLVLFFK